MDKIYKAAEWYLEKNWSVVPLNVTTVLEFSGKIRKILQFPNEWKSAQSRLICKEDIKNIWKGFECIGITTGSLSGITVIDFDKDDHPAMKGLPRTYKVKTRQGFHYYYKYNNSIKQSQSFAPGIDIRNDGGLVIAPPTTYLLPDGGSASYEIVDNAPLAEFPLEWYRGLLRAVGAEKKNNLDTAIAGVGAGMRNQSAASVAGSLLRRYSEAEWTTIAWPLFEAWNKTNAPPLGIDELETTWMSIVTAEQGRRRSGAVIGEPQIIEKDENYTVIVPIADGMAIFDFEDVEYGTRAIEAIVRCCVDFPGGELKRLSQRINILSSSAKESFSRQLKESFMGGQKIPWPLVFSQACELLETSVKKQSQEEVWVKEDIEDTQYLIHPFIERQASNIIFGKGGSGKTYLALSMAVALASKTSFLGQDAPESVNTLFVDYENTKSIWSGRISRLLKGAEIDEALIKDKMFYFVSKGIPIHELKYQLLDAVRRRKIGLVIIDSAALACGGEPESAEVVNRLFNAINRLNTTCLMIAHETKGTDHKNKSPFGSVFFYNCARNIWNVESSQGADEASIRVGLFHRKSNNDRLSAPKAAKIEFSTGKVGIYLDAPTLWIKEMGIKEQILDLLTEGSMTTQQIVAAIGSSEGSIRVRLGELKTSEKIINPERGKWALKTDKNYNTQNALL